MTADPPATLAQELKRLRNDRGITQAQLAKAMGVSAPLLSSWEREVDPVAPPAGRLKLYAEVFASARSGDGRRWHPIARSALNKDEEARRQDVENELLTLRAIAAGERPGGRAAEVARSLAGSLYRYPEDEDITIVCAELSMDLRTVMPYADPSDPDYVKLYNYADLDSLLELHGHIRACNPNSEVRFKLPGQLLPDNYTGHLVLLGGVDWNTVTRTMLAELRVPVLQVSRDDDTADAAFEVIEDGEVHRFAPKLDSSSALLQDVGHFVRGPNPLNRERTVSICNGMYGQGTYGTVRALTDRRFRDRNAEFIRSRFSADTYSLLFRVGTFNSVAVTPDWTIPGTVLHEWSEVAE